MRRVLLLGILALFGCEEGGAQRFLQTNYGNWLTGNLNEACNNPIISETDYGELVNGVARHRTKACIDISTQKCLTVAKKLSTGRVAKYVSGHYNCIFSVSESTDGKSVWGKGCLDCRIKPGVFDGLYPLQTP